MGRSLPVPREVFLKLQNVDLFRVLKYYNDYDGNSSHPSDFNKGGREQVERLLGEAAAVDPMRYLAMLPMLEVERLKPGYVISLLEGVANHLHYRFGRLQPPQDWQPIEPLPDGMKLATSLLSLIEGRVGLRNDGHATVRMLQACCEVLDDQESADRLVLPVLPSASPSRS